MLTPCDWYAIMGMGETPCTSLTESWELSLSS